MIERWPDELLKPTVDGFGESYGESRRFTQSQRGTPRIRRSSSRVAKPVRMVVRVLDANQRAIFDRFWDEKTADGTSTFIMPDPGRDGQLLTNEDGEVITDETGQPISIVEDWLCLFGQSVPDHRNVALQIWDISFDVMVMPI